MGDPHRGALKTIRPRRRVSGAIRRWLPVVIALLFAAQLVGPMRGESSVVAYPDVALPGHAKIATVYGSDQIGCPGLTLLPGSGTSGSFSGHEPIESVVVEVPANCRARWLQLTALEGETPISRGSVLVRSGSTTLTVRMSPAIDPRRAGWWSVSSDESR